MSRRHFQLIAAVLRRASLDPGLDRATVETIAHSFTVELPKENPRFDTARFLAAALAPEPAHGYDDRGDGVCASCGWGDVLHAAGACPVAVNGAPVPH